MKINLSLKNKIKDFVTNNINIESNTITIESADILSDLQKKIIIEKVGGLNFKNINYIINKDLIAGIIIKQGSSIIDLSLINQLSEIKKKLNEIT
jgi:F0F1-type ATP synthase delta subunit